MISLNPPLWVHFFQPLQFQTSSHEISSSCIENHSRQVFMNLYQTSFQTSFRLKRTFPKKIVIYRYIPTLVSDDIGLYVRNLSKQVLNKIPILALSVSQYSFPCKILRLCISFIRVSAKYTLTSLSRKHHIKKQAISKILMFLCYGVKRGWMGICLYSKSCCSMIYNIHYTWPMYIVYFIVIILSWAFH